jgi:hypothetical protein
MKPLVTCQFSGTCLRSQKFVESLNRFYQQSGQLWKQIARVLFGFRSAYIYTHLKGFLVSFLMMYMENCLIFDSKDIGQQYWKKVCKSFKFQLSWTRTYKTEPN